jgi:1-acyl-sn-glycerol-3-phosphate acyltransferase
LHWQVHHDSYCQQQNPYGRAISRIGGAHAKHSRRLASEWLGVDEFTTRPHHIVSLRPLKPSPMPTIWGAEQHWIYQITSLVSAPLIRLLFRPSVQGLQTVPRDTGYVLSANQTSNLDGWAIAYALLPRQPTWMGKAELFTPILAWYVRGLKIFPVKRGQFDRSAYETAVNLARSGNIVVIFPTGTRAAKGKRFGKKHEPSWHDGPARIAIRAGVPLVPVCILGTDRLTALQQWRVLVGTPIPLDDLADLPSKKAAALATCRLRKAIEDLCSTGGER